MTLDDAGSSATKPDKAWHRWLMPTAPIRDLAERRAAQLVALMSLVLFSLTLLVLPVVYAFERAVFWSRLPLILGVQASYALIYVLNRTGYHRVAAFLICLGPVWSDLLVGLRTPGDPIWYAFIPAGALLASILLSFRAAALIGALGAGAVAIVVSVHHDTLGQGHGGLIVGYTVIFTGMMLATARFRSWVEAGRREELLQLERQLAANQRLEAVGRLAASVAHDFNNFLMVIQGNAQLARLNPGTANLDDIEKAVERAAALTEQLLAFARQKPRKPVVLALNDVIRNLEPILTRLVSGSVQLSLRLDARGAIEADAVQLEQVLLNLAANARDAMPDGGRLEIATRNETVLVARPELPAGDYVLLTVGDSGLGMDAATLAHAFEPFFTTKKTGKSSGLGLATVRGVVDQNGGHIVVTSQPGRGTVFRIYLPRAQEESLRAEGASVGNVATSKLLS